MNPCIESPFVTTTWAALRSAGAFPVGAPFRPEEALELARSLAAPGAGARRRRSSILNVAAGSVVELFTAGGDRSPRLEPAPDSLPGLQEARAKVRIYRALDDGRVGEQPIPAGARILVGQREAEEGELLLIACAGALRLAAADERGQPAVLAEARSLGVVEGIVRVRRGPRAP